ncbi:MAG: hemerythrin domain-containing protein [Bdellovibrionales bacterium]|nr:hemerythrin domain-containing protein [Bdellovibrionales bacterium]
MNIEQTFFGKEAPLPVLANYIIFRYHEDLRKRFTELMTLAEFVEKKHIRNHACPLGLHKTLSNFAFEIKKHMYKEELILFPLINLGKVVMEEKQLKDLKVEHEAHERQMDQLRIMTEDFSLPEDACQVWKSLYKGLAKLEIELMEHNHLENSILYPRAIKMSTSLRIP